MTIVRPANSDAMLDGREIAASAILVVALAAGRSAVGSMAPEGLKAVVRYDLPPLFYLGAALFLMLGLYYAIARRKPRLGAIVMFPGILLFSEIDTLKTQFLIFYYGRGFPLADAALDRIDAAFGFRWLDYFAWAAAHPRMWEVLSAAYTSLWWQPFVLAFWFLLRGRVTDYSRLQIALPVSFVISCAVGCLAPALGAYEFYGMAPSLHPAVVPIFTDATTAPITWLRHADFAGPVPVFRDLKVITFPSWHAAAAAILVMSSWPSRRLRWIVLALNALMVLATPLHGSHYLTDVLVGLIIGGASFAITVVSLRMARRGIPFRLPAPWPLRPRAV